MILWNGRGKHLSLATHNPSSNHFSMLKLAETQLSNAQVVESRECSPFLIMNQ